MTIAIVVSAVLSGGVAELMQRKETVDGMVLLGYPAYFVAIIGFWKVFGAIALLLPCFPRLQEWTYAGIFFNMTGAAVSHAVNGDAAWHVVVTLIIAALTVSSWAFRPASRLLGSLPWQKIG